MNVIAIAGPKGSGKSEAAKALTGVRLSFGDPMKKMLMAIGVPVEALWGNDEAKSHPQEVLGGKSTRHAMVTLATEWGRDLIDYGIWVRAMEREVKHVISSSQHGRVIIIDDLRFMNELAWLQSIGAKIFAVEREAPGPMPEGLHISEQMPYRFAELGIPVIKNDSSIAELHRKVLALTAPPP